MSDSDALLVLGMHRSGTSALARLLHEAGVDVGERVVAASEGNEGGHWEDAFAVETDDRLLLALGRRWDDARPLPAGWSGSQAAREARGRIADYVAGSRLSHRLWAVKDPRMCLVADVWAQALRDAGSRAAAIVLARDPREVAASLAARDGMPPARAALLWMRYMLEAERATRGMPRVFATYDMLLREPLQVLARVRALPGWEALAAEPAAAAAVREDARHHRAPASSLQPPYDALWALFEQAAAAGDIDRDATDRVAQGLAKADAIYAPLLDDIAGEQATLWQRAARAEAALADEAGGLPELRDLVGVELRRMQDEHARAIASASGLAAQVGLAQEIAPGLAQLREGLSSLDARMADAVGVELRRMQEEHAKALESAAALSAEAAMARNLGAEIRQLQAESLARAAALHADIAARDAHVAALQDEVAKRDATVVALQGEVAKRDAHVAALQDEVAKRDATVVALQGEVAKRDAHVAALQGEVAKRDATVVALQGELGARDASVVALQGELGARDARILALEGELSSREAQVSRLRTEVAGQHALLQQIRTSHSWRITRPLRVAGRVLRGEAPGEGVPSLPRWLALRLAALPFLPRAFRTRKLLEGHGASRVVRDAEGAGQSVEASPAAPQLAPAGEKPDVIVWAVIDWHFRTQRPQHIARGLAEAGHRVFYVSNNLVDAPEPGFRVEPLDEGGRLHQVFLHAEGAPAIYYAAPTPQVVAQLRHSIGELLQWADTRGALCIVQHPFWSDVASRVPGSTLVYDCMDHHAGFEDNAPDVLAAEAELARSADLLVVTSDWLDRELEPLNPRRAVVRNACDFAHFNEAPATRYAPPRPGKVIGYYGAIAEWFDVELVRGVARAYPDCTLLLVGNDTAGAAAQLAGESNVVFTGEVPYDRLPHYLYAFDVALLPFRVIPLTLATNPVKVYEYLSAGKPVVSVDLPEMCQFGGLVRCASDPEAFLAAVGEALREDDRAAVQARIAFAREQTWLHRAEELDAALAGMRRPLASVVVLTYNNLDFTRACLHSIEANSAWPDLEVIVVDNASSDGTREFLREWEAAGAGRRAILNDDNLGFAAGNNVGLAAARGDYLVLLNNDTYVTPGWIGTMVRHLARNPDIGILGPVTNNIGNEARIEIHYADMAEMQRAAASYTRRHIGALFDIQTVAFFCVAMPRSTYERVGPLDEAFGIGFFEDDDYCRRVQAAGLRVACADDVFVHHHLSASFDALKAERKRELFERNKAIYEAKWGPWTPHAYRGH